MHEHEKAPLVNRVAIFLSLMGIPYTLFFAFVGLTQSAYLMIFLFLTTTIAFILNRYHKITLARFCLIIGISGMLLIYSLLLGKEEGAPLIFFPIIALPLILFSPYEKKSIIIGCLIPVLARLAYDLTRLNNIVIFPSTFHEPISKIAEIILFEFAVITAFLFTFYFVYFYFVSTHESQEKLKRSNNDLLEANQELQASRSIIDSLAQQATLGALTRTIVHEVKNPLASIDASCGNLLAQPLEEDVYLEIKTIKDQIKSLNLLTKTILKDAGTIPTSQTEVNINEILDQALRLISNEAFVRKIKIEKNLSSTIPKVKGNIPYISQAILNILVNALEHTSSGSITTTSYEEGSMVCIEITDTGKGIPEDMLTLIFDANTSHGKSSVERLKSVNAGMGLHFVKRITESHGGEVSVVSAIDKGSTFTLRFPKA